MRMRARATTGVMMAVLAGVLIAQVPAAGQRSASGATPEVPANWEALPQTPWGPPILQSVRDLITGTPSERQAQHKDREIPSFQGALSPASFGQRADGGATPAVTFYKDVLPILQARCQSCHRPGEAAPMSFLSYETTRPWAKAMKAAVIGRKMPPGGLDPEYGHFVDNFTLTQSQIDTIAEWADGGAIGGHPGDAPPPMKWVEGWRTKPDVVVEAPSFDVPAKGWVEVMMVILPNPFKTDTWVRSIEIRPGIPAVMHHAGVRFAPHKDGVKYGMPMWPDIKRDEGGVH